MIGFLVFHDFIDFLLNSRQFLGRHILRQIVKSYGYILFWNIDKVKMLYFRCNSFLFILFVIDWIVCLLYNWCLATEIVSHDCYIISVKI